MSLIQDPFTVAALVVIRATATLFEQRIDGWPHAWNALTGASGATVFRPVRLQQDLPKLHQTQAWAAVIRGG